MEGWRPGVLNKKQVSTLCVNGYIGNACNGKFAGASSIDLRITDQAYLLKGSFKPKPDLDIPTLIRTYKEKRLEFEDGKASLESGKTYIFEIKESLNFKSTEIRAVATGKSTLGRLDILVRLLTNKSDCYDEVAQDYTGSLWVEITPLTFPIKIKEGKAFNQLRLFKGSPKVSEIEQSDLPLWGDLILDEDGKPLGRDKSLSNLTLNLHEDPILGKDVCAYSTKKLEKDQGFEEIDLTIDIENDHHKIDEFWDALPPTENSPLALKIEPERFYILRSSERFKLPKSVAIYCQAVTENLGELRIHYAGFVHPRFGEERDDDKGAPLIFEVRGHNIQTFLQHGETLARLSYFAMSKDAAPYDCPYSKQELTLSNYFK